MLSRFVTPRRAAATVAAAVAGVSGGSAPAAGRRAAASAPLMASASAPRLAAAVASSAAPLPVTVTPEVASRAPAAAAPVRLAHTDLPAKTPPPPSGAPLPPVVLLHGLLGAASTYRSLVTRPDFVPARRVVSVDLRNHGHSPHVAGSMGWDVLSRDVLRLMDELALPTAAVVGHSLGGKVAMHMALTAPSRVAALTVVDIAPRAVGLPSGPPPGTTAPRFSATGAAPSPFEIVDILRGIPLDAPTSRAAVDARLAAAGVGCARTRAFVLTNLRAVPGGPGGGAITYEWRVNLAALAAAREELSGWEWPPATATATAAPDEATAVYGGPALFVRGTNSGYVDEARDGPAITRAFPRSRIVAVRGGHWLQADSPDEFCAVLNPFLEDAATAAAPTAAPTAAAAAGG